MRTPRQASQPNTRKVVRTYYFRKFGRCCTENEAANATLEQTYQNYKTFFYLPLRVSHDFYENAQIRQILSIYTKGEIDSRYVVNMFVGSINTKSAESPLGVISLRLRRENEDIRTRNVQPYVFKRLSLKYSRYSSSLEKIDTGLKDVVDVRHEGFDWVIQSFYGGTKIKYTREEDVKEDEDEEPQRFATRSIFSNQTGPQQQGPTSQQENYQDAQGLYYNFL
jgi:hypothetical protein